MASMAFAISLMTSLQPAGLPILSVVFHTGVVGDLIAHAENAVGAKALDPETATWP